jgi:hypothetical protein
VQLDTRGIPTVLIGTDRFHSTLVATRGLSGVPDARWAEVPHPVQSLDRAQLRERAELAVAQFVDIVLARRRES